SAARQRIAGSDRSKEFAIEIFRIVIAETAGCVVENRQRMNQSLLERERVNKRFQCRTRRARTTRSVDLAVDVDFVEVGRANLGEHIHCASIDKKRGGVLNSSIFATSDVISDTSLDHLMLFQVQRGGDLISTVRVLENLLNKMGRQKFSVSL